MTEELIQQLANELAPVIIMIVSTVASALVAWLAKNLNAYVATLNKNNATALAMARLDEVVKTVVAEIQQTRVEDIKRMTHPDSPGGTRVTPDEAGELVATAVGKISRYLGDNAGVDTIMKALGFTSSSKFQEFVRGKIEAAVYEMKANTLPVGELLTTVESSPEH